MMTMMEKWKVKKKVITATFKIPVEAVREDGGSSQLKENVKDYLERLEPNLNDFTAMLCQKLGIDMFCFNLFTEVQILENRTVFETMTKNIPYQDVWYTQE